MTRGGGEEKNGLGKKVIRSMTGSLEALRTIAAQHGQVSCGGHLRDQMGLSKGWVLLSCSFAPLR